MWIVSAVFGVVLMALAISALLIAERGEKKHYFARYSASVKYYWVLLVVLMLAAFVWLAIASELLEYSTGVTILTGGGVGLYIGGINVYTDARHEYLTR